MAEREVKVRTFSVQYDCDDCGGDVRYIGFNNPTSPPIYHHKCVKCGKGYEFRGTSYPFRRVRPGSTTSEESAQEGR